MPARSAPINQETILKLFLDLFTGVLRLTRLSAATKKKRTPQRGILFFLMADREGFEPSVAWTTTVFKTAPINHSGIRPFSILLTKSLLEYKKNLEHWLNLELWHPQVIFKENIFLHKAKDLIFTYIFLKKRLLTPHKFVKNWQT